MTAPRKQTGRRVQSEVVEESIILGRYNPAAVTLENGEVVELQLDAQGRLIISDPDGSKYEDMQGFFDGAYTFSLDYDADGNLTYLGKALIGNSKGGPAWQIKKFTYDINGNLIDIQWANSSDSYTNIWNDRTSLNYS